MLTLKSITKKYNDNVVLDNINLDLPDNGIVLLTGESGVGKTTLLNIIAKIDEDFQGELKTNKDITISYMSQEYNLLEELTVRDNINIFDNKNKNVFDIKELLNKKITSISGGENKRVSINKTFNKNANIYILDEPIESLDQTNIEIFKKYIKEKSKSSLIIIATHKQELSDIADIIVNINNKKIEKEIISISDDNIFDIKENKVSFKVISKLIFNRLVSNIKYNILNTLLLMIIFILLILSFTTTNINIDNIEAKELGNNKVVLTGNLEENNYNSVYIYEDIKLNINDNEEFKNIYYNYESNLITSSKDIREYVYGSKELQNHGIIITEYMYEVIEKYGIVLSDNSIFYPKTKDELLNKKTHLGNIEVEIVGIIKQDLSRYEPLKKIKEVKRLKEQNISYQFFDEIFETNYIYISSELKNELMYTNKTLTKQYLYLNSQKEFIKLKEEYKYKDVQIITPITTTLRTLEYTINIIRITSIILLIVSVIIFIIQFIKNNKDIKNKNKISNEKLNISGIKYGKTLNLIELSIPIILSIIISLILNIVIINCLNEIIKLYFFINFNLL